jgi:hypothetical protein
MVKYNFNQLDIMHERDKKEEDMRWKRGLF